MSKKEVIQAEFLGGYQDKKKSNGRLTFSDEGVNYAVFFSNTFEFKNEDIASVEIDGEEGVKSRVTFGRVVALGVFALAAKKKSKEAFVVITLKDGNEIIFRVPKFTPMELRSKVSRFTTQLRATA